MIGAEDHGQLGLVVRRLEVDDEPQFLAMRSALVSDGFEFAKDYVPGVKWSEYLAWQDRARSGHGHPSGFVPYTFLVAEAEGRMVGSSDIRHVLTPALARWGGHVGYVVAPDARRRGYGTEILRQTLIEAGCAGIARVRLTCRDENEGSWRVIVACGGVLEAITADGIRQYWVDVSKPS